jgi:hypothetical protein
MRYQLYIVNGYDVRRPIVYTCVNIRKTVSKVAGTGGLLEKRKRHKHATRQRARNIDMVYYYRRPRAVCGRRGIQINYIYL